MRHLARHHPLEHSREDVVYVLAAHRLDSCAYLRRAYHLDDVPHILCVRPEELHLVDVRVEG